MISSQDHASQTPPQRGPRPGLLWRGATRLAVILDRLGLARLLGRRFLPVEYLTPVDGARRRTVVEIIRAERSTGTYFVVSPWGGDADWLRHMTGPPVVTIRIGRREFDAVASPLPREAAARELARYARRHPNRLPADSLSVVELHTL